MPQPRSRPTQGAYGTEAVDDSNERIPSSKLPDASIDDVGGSPLIETARTIIAESQQTLTYLVLKSTLVERFGAEPVENEKEIISNMLVAAAAAAAAAATAAAATTRYSILMMGLALNPERAAGGNVGSDATTEQLTSRPPPPLPLLPKQVLDDDDGDDALDIDGTSIWALQGEKRPLGEPPA